MRMPGVSFWMALAVCPLLLFGAASDALHRALASGDMTAAAKLVAEGSDVNAADASGLRPLYYAAAIGTPEIVSLLIDKGADINGTDKNGFTPIFQSIGKGRVPVTERLISRDANVNAASRDGVTPLHTAANSGYLEIVRLLVDKGARLDANVGPDSTPLDAALFASKLDVAGWLAHRQGLDLHQAVGPVDLSARGLTSFVGTADVGMLCMQFGGPTVVVPVSSANKGQGNMTMTDYSGRLRVGNLIAFGQFELDARGQAILRSGVLLVRAVQPAQGTADWAIAVDPGYAKLVDDARGGDPPALLRLAGYYFSGGDFDRFFSASSKAAVGGDRNAVYYVGVAYDKGFGVDPDPVQAFDWYRRAGEKGQDSAQYNCAVMSLVGRGVKKDAVAAYAWALAARESGYKVPQSLLDGIKGDLTVEQIATAEKQAEQIRLGHAGEPAAPAPKTATPARKPAPAANKSP